RTGLGSRSGVAWRASIGEPIVRSLDVAWDDISAHIACAGCRTATSPARSCQAAGHLRAPVFPTASPVALPAGPQVVLPTRRQCIGGCAVRHPSRIEPQPDQDRLVLRFALGGLRDRHALGRQPIGLELSANHFAALLAERRQRGLVESLVLAQPLEDPSVALL